MDKQGVIPMKKLFALLLLSALLLSLCACGEPPAEVTPSPLPTLEPTPEPTPTPTPRPPFVPEGEATMGKSFQRLDDGTLYCANIPLKDYIYVPQWLEEDYPYIDTLLVNGETLYFVVKTSYVSYDPASIYAADLTTGETRLLAEDGAINCRLAMVDGVLIYNREDGLRAIDPLSGEQTAFLSGSYTIMDACGGWLFYCSDENGMLCRNSAALSAEEALFAAAANCALSVSTEALALLVPGENLSGYTLYLLDWYGQIQTEAAFASTTLDMFAQSDEIYLLDVNTKELTVWSMEDLSQLRSIEVDPELEDFYILYIDRDGILHQRRRADEPYTYWRMDPDGGNAVELDTRNLS